MSYLFPILKCGKIYAIWNKLNSEQCHSDYRYYLGFAEDAYKIATSRYPGFGFLLSFFPGTSAYKARIALSTRLKSKRQELLDNIKKVLDIAETRDGEKRIFILEKQMWKSSLAGLFNMFLIITVY